MYSIYQLEWVRYLVTPQKKLAFGWNKILREIIKSYKEYSTMRTRMLALESIIQIAKKINCIINNDLEVIRTIPLTYLSLFIQGALNICNARQLNPTSFVNVSFSVKYGIVPGPAIQLIDLLDMAKVAIELLISR